ncbi:T9SS type B sorting domain-containing protein [Flavobacterium sp. NRK F10]|uniref:T9SS type B sorting domain-containing protein n=1 Tax=Flavobacterium sp. NRK F10 TaxID=2954931 RepID=UPI0020903D67|nr:T9SS type B sorting domain-containing protein [Flavobacterium sp. NRK F10]MCO6175672.1 T9SS type B sorting domain-containing protein [Flavobacterium sp. NRK F10]
MNKLLAYLLLLTLTFSYSQNTTTNQKSDLHFFNGKVIENRSNFDLSDSIQRIQYLANLREEKEINTSRNIPFTRLQSSVFLCSNSNFEEFESVNNNFYLKDYSYATGDPSNPMQCKPIQVQANQLIPQYNPNQSGLMATTVPSNYYDEFIGEIDGFDQYVLKLNHKNSYTTSSVVQTKRFKTNNETEVKFNFKTVLESIPGSNHDNEQPYFKARIIKNGSIISEFCLIGDPENCIFTEAGSGSYNSIILYTQNWQSGILDISSIPNNEDFTIEFMASRCGLSGHFGYAYIDDLCLLHSNENLQGSIELDPLYLDCPTFPLSICGSFTIPNSGGISADIDTITLNIKDENNQIIFSSSTPSQLDLTNETFCFTINQNDLPAAPNTFYNLDAEINYNLSQTTTLPCTGTSFNGAVDDDANPGWDISFLNCNNCPITLQTTDLFACDSDGNGKEFFNLTDCESQIVSNNNYTFSYFATQSDAYNDTNAITVITNYESYTNTIFVRVTQDSTCYKITPIQLIVKNPYTTISGILNVCSGSTTLTASQGASYLWSTGETTQSIDVYATGTYSVTVTDSYGCSSTNQVTILPNQVAVLPTISVSQPDCFSPHGTITVTSPASEYSYDDGLTWSTNAQMTNLSVGTYYVKIRTIMGCESYSSPVTITPFLSPTPNVTYTNPAFCGDTGTITVTTASTEYSFDDGLTWTTNNTMSNLPIGTYHIRVKDQNGCISNPKTISFYDVFLDPPTYTVFEPFCSLLGTITITTNATEYSFDGGNTWQTSNTLFNVNTGTYIIKIKNEDGCISPNVYVNVYNFQNIQPNYTIDPAGCDKYATVTITTLGDEYSFDGGVTWSTSNTIGNLNGGNTVTIKVRRANCESLNRVVTINSYYLPLPVVNDFSTLICDSLNDGHEITDLNAFNNEYINNSNNYTFQFYNSQQGALTENPNDRINNPSSYDLINTNQSIYVTIKDSNGCFSVATLELEMIASPVIDLENLYYLCENFTVTISEDSNFDSYTWSEGTVGNVLTVDQPGNYSLTVTEDHGSVICSATKTFQIVLSNPATIVNFETHDWTVENNTIQINVTGLGDYEYSLNGIDYQDSNLFTELPNGEYTVYVRDKHGCGVSTGDIYLLMYPKYFTPNQDGYNDTWKIKFSDNEPNLQIKIFNRYGKFLKQLSSISEGWDGTYLGQQLPSDDYWFVVIRENGKEHRGHFSLKR